MTAVMRLRAVAALCVALVLLAGCGFTSAQTQGFDTTVDEALKAWQAREAVILDVRTPGEYAEGHVPGAIFIPLDQLGDRFMEVPKDKKVYVICRSGNRSSQATRILRDKGYDNAYNVTGGMGQWRGPVEKGSKKS